MKKDIPLGWTVLPGGLGATKKIDNTTTARCPQILVVDINPNEKLDTKEARAVAEVNRLYVALQTHLMGEPTESMRGEMYHIPPEYSSLFGWHIKDMTSAEFPESYEHYRLYDENNCVIGISFVNTRYATERGHPAVNVIYAMPHLSEEILRPSPVKAVVFDWVQR